jgi:hypothetical protein
MNGETESELHLLGLPDQARRIPGLAAVGALDDADRGWRDPIASALAIAGEDVDGARVLGVDRDIVDREHWQGVGERRPGDAIIAGAPKAAGRRSGIDRGGLGRVERDCIDAPGVGALLFFRRLDLAPVGDNAGRCRRCFARLKCRRPRGLEVM